MAIGRYSKSRNLPAHNRLQKRRCVRRVLLETLEPRQLMAVGPQLIGIQPNSGDLLQNGEILHQSPTELVFRFNDGAGIDPTTLGGIRVVRSGEDGVFERASIATDFGTGGQTLVEFYAQTPGQAGNGIELRFTAVSRTDSRVPILRVSGRRIDVELNSNPALQTRVEDLLRVFERDSSTAATSLVFALPLRGSQTIAIGGSTDTTRPLILSGANSAKGSTNFGLSNSLEARFVARDSGSTGLGISINVTRVDRGGAAAPTVTVSGKSINVVLNSNPLNATTAREFVDAINAQPAAAQLIEAQLVSGSGATRIGTAATSYSPITLSGVTDIEILPGYIGLGDSNREVVLRFAEPLPDDFYRIEILGQGTRTLRNVAGEPFNMGISASIVFELQLGAQILSVVPQPVSKDPVTGALSWNRREEIDVYFSRDALIDVKSIVSVNGVSLTQVKAERGGILYLQNTDVIVFAGGAGQRGVLDPQYYQLINSKGTLNTTDDAATVLPTRVRYYPDADRVSLRYERDLSTYAEVGGELRLRIGTNEARPLPPVSVDALTVDPADTFANAVNLNSSWTPGAAGSQAVVIDSKIENTVQTPLDFPGGDDEPGNRQNLFQSNLRLGADGTNGISTISYNFQGSLGQNTNGTPNVNAITEQQKERVREVFSLYEKYLGVRFVETTNLGLTVAVGDTRAVIPFEDTAGAGSGVIDINGPGNIYYESGFLASNLQAATVLDIQDFSDSNLNGFGGSFQRAAMQGIGRLLGLGLADEVAALTVQSFDGALVTPGVGSEIVFPGNADIVHGQYLYRPDSKDIDLYQFTLPVAGRISIEAFAERMSKASLLDSQIRLFQRMSTGWEEIAANDDYFSSDSFVELELSAGNYIVGVSASGNDRYNPVIGDSGLGGKSQGNYQLRIDFQPPAPAVLRDADSPVGTELDGDGDGTPGGTFNFWFKPSTAATTKFVDKSTAGGGNGSVATPYNNIGAALAASAPGTVVRVVGNGGADKNFATQADDLAYEIGFNALGQPLPDGATLDVPKDVTLMIDAGAILKMRRSRIGVGSTSVNVDRSGGALLVLGTPTLQTADGLVLKNSAGIPIAGSVYITSLNDSTIGKNATTTTVGPTAGDWGGIDIRARVDASTSRNRAEDQGIFLNWISNADLRYGGGQVVVDGTSQSITPLQMVDSRPTVVSSFITLSAEAALSATPNSFKESNFHSPAEQGHIATPFSVDYDRVGPKLRGNRIVGNSINGLQVRVRTAGSTQLEKLTVQGRFDDIDVVHFLPENLEIQGTAGGAVLIETPPNAAQVQLALQPGGSLPTGFYTYVFSSIDSTGAEGVASTTTSFIQLPFTTTDRSIVLSNLPTDARNVYRSSNGGLEPYVLIARIAAGTSSMVDNGSDLGVALPNLTGAVSSRLDARLVIDGGTVIKSTGSRIDVVQGAQLIAEGTAGNPVVFTSLNDSRYGVGGTFDTANRTGRLAAAAGDWGGLYIGHTSSASLDHVVLAYGGGTTRIEGGFADFSGLEVHQADVRLANSRLEFNATGARTTTDADRAGRGFNEPGTVFVRGAQPIIVNNVISNNLGPAMSFDVSSLNSDSVTDWGRSTGRSDSIDGRPGNQGPLIAGNIIQNTAGNSAINGLLVRQGNLTTEGVWDDTDIVHVVQGEIVVPDFQHYGGLRLASSAEQSLVVKFFGTTAGTTAGITATGQPLDNADRIGGSVQLIGTPNYPVILTSLNDDSVGAGFTTSGLHQVDTNNNGSATSPVAGNWRGLLLETFSNDRNVLITQERESARAGAPAANDTTARAQYLGTLAPNEKAGDENQRLGFQISGNISAPSDVDVFSFHAGAGTEVWLDIDRTLSSLDTVVELVDANGRTLALSDSSLLEERDPTRLFKAGELADQSVNPLRKSPTAFYYQSALGEPKDLYSTNPQDAGLRVVLPGAAGSNNLYHVRVRSSNLRAGDPATQLLDPAKLHDGLTSGRYQLQVRLGEVDEVPGSAITHADIRFAQTGIRLVGVPSNSPLLGENAEVEVGPGAVENDIRNNAQPLGNLLQSNRQAISVAGNLDDFTDVDWFSFDLTYDKITPVQLREYFATIIDVDYADGIGRPDVSLYVFNSAGNLILSGLSSDLAGDQSSPNGGNSELGRGSAGINDPFIGPYMLPTETQLGADTAVGNVPAGRYFLAVTNSDMVPAILASYTDPTFADNNMRLQPIEGIRLIAEDHVRSSVASTAVTPIVPILFPTPGDFDFTTSIFYDTTNDSIVDFNLSDMALYVSRDVGLEESNLYIVNPFTGQQRNLVGNGDFDVRDIDFRPNGTLAGFDRTLEARPPANTDADTLTDYFTIDPGTGVFTDAGDFGLQTSHIETSAAVPPVQTVVASDDGFNIEAMTFAIIAGLERGIAVGNRPTPPGEEPAYSFTRFINTNNTGLPGFNRPGPSYFTNVIYEFDENTGAATSAPAANKQNLAIGQDAGTEIRDRGYIETFTLNATGAIVRQASELVAKQVTQATPSGANFLIRNGDSFVIQESGGALRRVEFDLGPEVQFFTSDPNAILNVADGLQFTLDGTTYEFDKGAPAGVAPGAVAIPLGATVTLRSFVDAIASRMPSGITVSFDGGRMNFGGAAAGNFSQLESAGILTSLGNPGTPGAILVPVLASDTAQVVATRIADAINSSGLPGLIAAVNPLAPERVQIGNGATFQSTGPLDSFGVAPGGIVTGIAMLGNNTGALANGRMYAVSDAGGLYFVDNPISFATGNRATYVDTSYELTGIRFSGLVEGPVRAHNGTLSQILFGIDDAGVIHAFDTAGRLQPVFANGATSVSTGLTGATGLTMPALDFNLWHVSSNRSTDADAAGHGAPATPNNSRENILPGQNLYFGFQSPASNGNSVAGGLGDLTGPNAVRLPNTPDTYNFPGGAAGAIESAPIDLSSVTAGSLPTLYFNYRFDTEDASADLPLGNNNRDYMRDSLRVYGAGADGKWILLATNNDAQPEPNVSNRGQFDDEFDFRLTGNRETQPLFDNRGAFRQARVPLDALAGNSDVRIRVEFSTHGGFGFGRTGGKGPEIRTISGDRLTDGESLVLNGQRFEIDMGLSLSMPSGSAIPNGTSLSIEGVQYVFTDGTSTVTAPAVPVTISPTMSGDQIALQLQQAIRTAAPNVPVVGGLSFTAESNDTTARALATGITGDNIRLSGSGNIGDNPSLVVAGEDVDMFKLDLDQDATVNIDIAAEVNGSTLDSFLRVFDAEGNQLASNNNRPGSTDSRLTFTAPTTGRYYIGVSGAGNQAYSAVIPGKGAAGSTGDYQLTVEVLRSVSPLVASNRLQLLGAKSVSLPAGSPLVLQGAIGASNGHPVNVTVDMTAAEVAVALQQSVASFFAGGATGVYPVRSNTIDLSGLINYSSFDPISRQRTPSTTDFAPGPFGGTTNFIGDAFSSFNLGTNFDGTLNNANPGALGAQSNNFEGVYLDDFIIGLAGRGEMVLNSTSINTTFVADPQDRLANPSQARADQEGVEITVGPYQFEIRGGDNYGVPLLPGPVTLFLTEAFEPDALQSPGLAIQFNSAGSIVAGDTFTLSDGTAVLTFEMDDTHDSRSVQPGNIAVPFSTSVVDPITGNRVAESGRVIAARVRDLINSNAIQAQIKVSANLLNNDRTGATSDTVILIGQASVNVPTSIGQTITYQGTGTSNRQRPQGQVVITGTKISNSQNFGVDIASPGRAPVTNAPLLGSPRNTVTLNVEGLAPGAVIMNSELVGNAAGGIRISGEPVVNGVPRATVPFVRVVNNTILGGSVTGSAGAETFTAGGQGVVVSNNAAATLLNNVIANSTTAINVDASSSSATINGIVYQRTVVGGTLFYQNTDNIGGRATLGQFPITNIPAGTRVFVDPANGNLYPAPTSPLIDSSIDSLQDRTSLVAVKQPLGIAASPILAPQFDINGQLRADDPAVETPAGLGENVFKDRGAQDRADFVGPSVVLINPVDNDFEGLDGNPTEGVVELTGGTLRYFDIHIVDGLEPSDPSLGSGVDHRTVTSSSVLVYGPKVVDGVRQQSQPLVEGRDYVFGYDGTNGIVRLTPLAGIWEPEAVYTIRFLNSAASALVAPSTYTDGQQVSVVDSTNTTTIYEFDYGYLVSVPTLPTDLTTLDARTFALDDGGQRFVFEFDTDGIVSSGNTGINIAGTTSPEALARLIENAINSTSLTVTVDEVASGQLQIQGSRQVQFDANDSGLVVSGRTGVQTAFGIQIPLRAGVPFGLVDGQIFTINRTGTPVTFELDSDGTVAAGNRAVSITAGASADAVANSLVFAITAAALGLTPVNTGNGLVTIGGDANTVLDMTQTVLRQSGLPGQPAAIAIPIALVDGQSSEALALTLKQAIDASNLPGVTTTLFGNRILIEGATSVGGVGAEAIAPIRDLASNPLKANQLDGTTTLTIFQGEGLDYGDAPAPYASQNIDNGARHKVVNGLSLGATVTADADARLPDADSDDGVTIAALFASFASNATLIVNNTTGGPAFVSMWIDFDGNGTFADSERFVSSQAITAASTTVTFSVPKSTSDGTSPARTKVGDTFARVRLSSSPSAVASPVGAAADGEVEDYRVTISANPFHNAASVTDAFGNGLDVSGDGFVSAIDVLQIINWINDPTKPDFPTLADATGAPPFVDVNGDGIVSALDSSIVITYLNSRPRVVGGEGEGASSDEADMLLGEGEEVVLSSNWAGGLENVLPTRLSPRSQSAPSARDQALLQTDDDNTELAVSVASHVAAQAVDAFWDSLSQTPDESDSIVDELEYVLIEDLLK